MNEFILLLNSIDPFAGLVFVNKSELVNQTYAIMFLNIITFHVNYFFKLLW